MATHDYVIDNNTGANVRADINSVLKAILTNNSGTTDPATVISSDAGSKAFSFWADTNSSPAVLKIRNAADNAWIELFQLDGTLTLEDGSASTPALAFRDDLNTGIYSSAADTFNVATGGVERMELGATTIFNEDGEDVDFRIEGDTKQNLFYLDAGNDRIGIGTSSIDRFVHIEGTDNVLLKLQNNQTVCLMEFEDTDTTSGNRPAIGADGNNAVFYTGGAQKMVIDSSGRVGVNEDSPSSFNTIADNLVITEASTHAGMTIRSGTSHQGNIAFQDAANTSFRGALTYDHNGDKMQLITDGDIHLTIDSDGRVMIGVTSTGHASANADDLCVGNNDSSSQHGITIGSNAEGSIRWADSASGSAGILNYRHSSDAMEFYTVGTLRMTIDGSGNIGAPSGTNIYNASDLRLKKNVVDLDKGLSVIKSLRPVSFNWIDGFCDDEKNTLYGFIAQEVETIDRNLIQEFGNGSVTVEGQTINDALRVNEKLIIPMLVKAVQELEAKVAALKSA